MRGNVFLVAAEVAGRLRWDGLKLRRELQIRERTFYGPTSILLFTDTSVGTTVQAMSLTIDRDSQHTAAELIAVLKRVQGQYSQHPNFIAAADRALGEYALVPQPIAGGSFFPPPNFAAAAKGVIDAVSQDSALDYAYFLSKYGSGHSGEHKDLNLVMNLASTVGNEFAVEIDLRGGRAKAMEDTWPKGWGGEEAVEHDFVKLKLDGFVYDRIVDLPAEKVSLKDLRQHRIDRARRRTAGLAAKLSRKLDAAAKRLARLDMPLGALFRWWARLAADTGKKIDCHERLWMYEQRLQWLRLHPPEEFRPQPYRHLARVLRAHGNPRDAREISIGEAWDTPTQWWDLIWKLPFGVGFRFGLSPGRAFITCVIFIAIGSAGVWRAEHNQYMVLTTSPVASKLVDDGNPDAPQAAIEKSDMKDVSIEPLCSNQIVAPFYALDLMLPVIPLHQETAWIFPRSSHRLSGGE